MPESTSLRERSKDRRRHEIQVPATRLIAERGYAGTTIAEIAAAADVAPSTVMMYFATKRDIALASMDDLLARLVTVFQKSPDLTFTAALDTWLRRIAESATSDLMVTTCQMLRANPELHAVSTSYMNELQGVAITALVAESGLDAGDPMDKVISAALAGSIGEYFVVVLPNWDVTAHYLQNFVTAAIRTGHGDPNIVD